MVCTPSVKVWKRPNRKASPRFFDLATPLWYPIGAELSFEVSSDVGGCSWFAGEVNEVRDQCVGIGTRHVGLAEAPIVQSRSPEDGEYGFVEHGAVRYSDRVQRDAHQRALHDCPVGKRSVEVGKVEVGETVPHGQIRRGGLLGLKSAEVLHSGDHVQIGAFEEELTIKRGPRQLPCAQLHSSSWGALVWAVDVGRDGASVGNSPAENA